MHPKRIISVAIVGLGRAGWCLHLTPMFKLEGFKIVAVVDPDVDRCGEAFALTGCKCYSSIDTLLTETEAELVVVATPSVSHYADTLKVLSSGRHCVTEKPLASSFSETRELVDLASRLKLKLFVHHTHLHLGEYHHLRKIIESNVLGPIFHLRVFWGSYSRRWDWQTLRKNGGGQLMNTGSHVLSVVLPLLGSPVASVYSDLRNIKDAGDAEDHVHLVLKTEGGVTADIVVSSAIAQGMPRWILCGRYGTLVSDRSASRLRYYDSSEAPPLTVLDAAAPGRKYLSETLPWKEEELEITPLPVSSFAVNILEVLLDDAPQIVTPESVVEVARVIELAQTGRSAFDESVGSDGSVGLLPTSGSRGV